jgi:hypothetical protein
MKRNVLSVIAVLLLSAMIISGCGGGGDSTTTSSTTGTITTTTTTTSTTMTTTTTTTTEQESYIDLMSASSKSVITVKQTVYGMHPTTSYFNFNLTDSNKVFVTVTLWIKPSSANITMDMADILVVNDGSEQCPLVGFGTGGQYMEYVFTSVGGTIEFSAADKSFTMYDCVFEYSDDNAYGISCPNYGLSKVTMGQMSVSMGDNPSITFAFVVSKASVNSGNIWLKVPNSPLIKLSV